MSSFSALNVGARAIQAAQRGLDTTGQNISNVSTEGYTRQRVDQVSVGGPTVPALWAKYDGAGGGVDVIGVSRVRDEFLEARARTATAALGNLTEQQKAYSAIEQTVGEPSTTGLQAQIADFWNSWSKVSNSPLPDEARNLTFERAQGVATQLNRMSTQLTTQWTDTRTELDANVSDVNQMAKDVAGYNKAIRNNTINGLPANELADARDLLIGKIATLTGATASRGADGVVDVNLGGQKLVDGGFYRQIDAVAAGDQAGGTPATWADRLAAGAAPTTITWAAGSPELSVPAGAVTLGTGTMSAQVLGLDSTIPSYVSGLDTVATKLATVVNAQQASGYAVNAAPGVTGSPLFTSLGGPLTAATIQVDPALTGKSLAVSTQDPNSGILNGDNAASMATHLGEVGGADESFRGLVITLGVEAQSINRNTEVQTNVVKTADDARESVSGVSLDEEMTNLISYQHSYGAAAKYISIIDSTIESLLNMVR